MLEVEARIIWKTSEEGGLSQQPFSGIQPSFSVGEDLIACIVSRKDNGATMDWGKEYEVSIKLPYGEAYVKQVYIGMEFNLNLGGRIIGNGLVRLVH